jgi:GntR family histidine utilization transcriptional repressor
VSASRDIHDELMRRVRAREWRVGEAIPHEVALAAEFGVARATMNKVLSALAAEGVLERRRRAGTRVAALPVRQARLEIPLIRREVEETGGHYACRLIDRRLGAAPAMPDALLLTCLHQADGAPFMLETRAINLAVVPAAREADFSAVTPNEWLVDAMPFTEADFAFTAAAATEEEALRLQVKPGAALFISERATFLGRETITQARMAYRPGHRMTTRI